VVFKAGFVQDLTQKLDACLLDNSPDYLQWDWEKMAADEMSETEKSGKAPRPTRRRDHDRPLDPGPGAGDGGRGGHRCWGVAYDSPPP